MNIINCSFVSVKKMVFYLHALYVEIVNFFLHNIAQYDLISYIKEWP